MAEYDHEPVRSEHTFDPDFAEHVRIQAMRIVALDQAVRHFPGILDLARVNDLDNPGFLEILEMLRPLICSQFHRRLRELEAQSQQAKRRRNASGEQTS